MTRAAPLVLFVLSRRAALPHLLRLACLALCIALAGTPPPGDPNLATFFQEQPCLDDPTEAFVDSIAPMETTSCKPRRFESVAAPPAGSARHER